MTKHYAANEYMEEYIKNENRTIFGASRKLKQLLIDLLQILIKGLEK